MTKLTIRLRDKIIDRYGAKLEAMVNRVHRKLLARIKAHAPIQAAMGDEEPLVSQEEIDELRAYIERTVKVTYKIGRSQAEAEGYDSGDTALQHQPQLNTLTDEQMQYSRRLVDDQEEASNKIIREVIQEQGPDTTEMARRMESELGMFQGRARAIATTETAQMYSKSYTDTLKSNGIDRVTWRTNEGACDECEPLDGRVMTIEEFWMEFPKHPNCVLQGTKINSAFSNNIELAFKAFYSGPAIEIITRTNKRLRVTPNHPILTPHGFVHAELLREGMDVLSYSPIVKRGLPTNNNQDSPLPIEDIFDLLASFGVVECMPASTPYLHGDARSVDGNIYIARPNRELRNIFHSNSIQLSPDDLFMDATCNPSPHFGPRPLKSFGEIPMSALTRLVSRRKLSRPLHRIHPRPVHGLCLGHGPQLDASASQEPSYGVAPNSILLRELQDRHSAEIFIDNILRVSRFEFKGHVYDLQTTTHIYTAEYILTHNCKCWAEGYVEE